MTQAEKEVVRRFASDAAEIAALCLFLGQALTDDPDTSNAGVAVGGLGSLAHRLAGEALTFAE